MPITDEERQYALKLLEDSRTRFIGLIEGLTADQFHFQHNGGWSAAMIAEHVYIAEKGIIRHIVNAPPNPETDPRRDAEIVRFVRDQKEKREAPERIVPKGRITDRDDLVRVINETRDRAIQWLNDPTAEHRQHAMPHRFLGVLDGYQWILMTAAHFDRHSAQIEEFAATANFPKA